MAPIERNSTTSRTSRGKRLLALSCIIILIGFALRVLVARGELWLDEIWSLQLAAKAPSAIDILAFLHVDNNHILNTLLLYWLGEQSHDLTYRLPAVVTGTGAIILAGLLARRWGSAAAIFAQLLVGLSYPLIQYSSEARGYAPAAFFSLAALYALERFLKRRTMCNGLCFSAFCVFGFLSHLLFIQTYIALLAWSVFRACRSARRWDAMMTVIIRCHTVPVIAFVFLYVLHIRHIWILGGPQHPLLPVLANLAAYTIGLPRFDGAGPVALVLTALILVGGLILLYRRRDDLGVLLASVVIIAPLLLVLATSPELLYERYFLLPALFLLLLVAFVLGELYGRGLHGRIMAIAACGLILIGNCRHTARLVQRGRGHYVQAIEFMVDHTAGDTVLIGGDHDFRHDTVISHYGNRLGIDKTLDYRGAYVLPPQGPQWFLAHSFDDERTPRSHVDRFGNTYELAAAYPSAPLSGWHLFVYHRRGAGNLDAGRNGYWDRKRGRE